MDQGRPRRFIFRADAPKGSAVQQVQLVYTWNFHPYGEPYDRKDFWVPVEILIDSLVRRGPRQAVISERWTLEKILAVRTTDVGPPQVVPETAEVEPVAANP